MVLARRFNRSSQPRSRTTPEGRIPAPVAPAPAPRNYPREIGKGLRRAGLLVRIRLHKQALLAHSRPGPAELVWQRSAPAGLLCQLTAQHGFAGNGWPRSAVRGCSPAALGPGLTEWECAGVGPPNEAATEARSSGPWGWRSSPPSWLAWLVES